MKHYRKFAEDIGLIGIANLLNNFKSLLVIPLITKSLGLVDYGVWVQFKTTLLLLLPFAALGVHNSIVKFLAGQKDRQNISEDFYSCLFISLIGGIILAIIFYILSSQLSVWIFRSPKYEIIIKLLAVVLILESISLLFLEYLKTFRYMRLYFITLFFEMVFELGLIYYSVCKGYGIIGVVISLLIARAVFILIRYVYIYNDIGFSPVRFAKIKKYVTFGLPLVISSTFFFVLNSGDRYVINYFLGLKYVSLYSLAYFLAYTIVLVTAPIVYILYPTLGAFCNNKNYGEASLYIKYCTKYLMLIGMPIVFGILMLSKRLILIFSTKEFIDATIVMPFLLAGLFIFQIGVISVYVIILFGRIKQIVLLYLILAIVNIGLNIIVIPHQGIMGAALITLITFIGFTVFSLIYARRFIKYTFNYSFIVKSIIAASIMSIIILLLEPQSLVGILFSTLFGGIVYFVLLYLLRTFENKEILLFKNLFSPFIKKIKFI